MLRTWCRLFLGLVYSCLLLRVARGQECSCLNAVPNDAVIDTLERALSAQVAGHDRVRERSLAYVRQQMWKRESGIESALRLHMTGPSGVGKSFLAKVIATSYFEESAKYTGLRFAGAATSVSVLAMAAGPYAQAAASVVSSVTTATAVGTALAVAPLAAGGAAAAAVAGWRLVEFGEKYWRVDPAPYPTQCGIYWRKFPAGASVNDAENALKQAAKTLKKCKSSVLVFEDVNRLDLRGLQRLERLTEPILQASKSLSVSLSSVTILFTSDLHNDAVSAVPALEEAATYEEAEALVELQSRAMWQGNAPAWWDRDFATLAMPPLSDSYLDRAVELYLLNHLAAELRATLRARINARRPSSWRRYAYDLISSYSPAVSEWTGQLVFNASAVDQVRDFVRRGPDDWRCHAITHFHTTFVEPAIDAGVETLLEAGVLNAQGTLSSSLKVSFLPRTVSAGSLYERRVYDTHWQIVHVVPPPSDSEATS